MNTRIRAFVALLITAAVPVMATAGVAAMTILTAGPEPNRVIDGWSVLPARELVRVPADASQTPPPEPAATEVAGVGSNYPGTAGWIGEATVALPGDLGGRYTGRLNGQVTVCGDRCVRLPVVDWCDCYWGTDQQRVVDLSHAAWPLVSDAPLDAGLIQVRVIVEGNVTTLGRPSGSTSS